MLFRKTTPTQKALKLAHKKGHRLISDFATSKNTSKYFGRKEIENLMTGLDNRVAEIFSANKPFLQYREYVAHYMIEYCELWVFVNQQREGNLVSGELTEHIQKYAEHSETLTDFIHQYGNISLGDMLNLTMMTCCYRLYFLECMLAIAEIFNDRTDWHEEFKRVQLAWEEHSIRLKLGLPTLFDNDIEGLHYGLLCKEVSEGALSPIQSWKKKYNQAGDDNSE